MVWATMLLIAYAVRRNKPTALHVCPGPVLYGLGQVRGLDHQKISERRRDTAQRL